MTDTHPHAGARPLCTGPHGMALLSFHPAPADQPDFTDAPLGAALVVLRHESSVLLVHQRQRACWELPGGRLEPGETPQQAAVRELREESGQVADGGLRLAGYAKTALGAAGTLQYSAVFTGVTTRPRPFLPNEEVSEICWQGEDEELPGGRVQTVDLYLVRYLAEHGLG